HGFTAVAYIVSGFVGRSGYVSRDELLAMDRAGIEIGSHTVDHADLARTSPGRVTYELVESKRWLEQLVGHPVVDFAYPSGKFNPQTIDAVRRAGYGTAVTTAEYTLQPSLVDRYTWSRVRVGGSEPMPEVIDSRGRSIASSSVANLSMAGLT